MMTDQETGGWRTFLHGYGHTSSPNRCCSRKDCLRRRYERTNVLLPFGRLIIPGLALRTTKLQAELTPSRNYFIFFNLFFCEISPLLSVLGTLLGKASLSFQSTFVSPGNQYYTQYEKDNFGPRSNTRWLYRRTQRRDRLVHNGR